MPAQYLMSAIKTSNPSGKITWTANGAPDYTGAQSGFTGPGELININLESVIGGASNSSSNVLLPGVTGPAGPAGAAGQQGSPGVTGLQGSPGVTGPQGIQGSPGPTGTAGTPGTGAMGPQGSPGVTGYTGPQGAQGSPGVTGYTGPQGGQGSPGVTGTFNTSVPSGTTIAAPVVTAESVFKPASSVIGYAVVNSQIFTSQITSGTATGIVFQIPFAGTTGAPIGTGVLAVDCEVTAKDNATGAARWKQTMQWNYAQGVVGAMGPLVQSLSVGTFSGVAPSGWAATLQQSSGPNAAMVINNSPSGFTGTVDIMAFTQWSYVS